MLGGLIAGALKGASEGYGVVAKGELENQQKLDYAQKILEMQTEKDLRVDEIKRDRDIKDIGRKTEATATAEAAAAPIKAKGEVAGKVAGLEAATAAGLPEAQGKYKLAEVNAAAPAAEAEARVQGKVEAVKQTTKTQMPGFLESLSKEDFAKSAGERSVAGIGARAAASAPKIMPLGDGTMAVVEGGKITSYLTDPKTGEKIMGPKDLDQRTTKMVDALLLSAKSDLDPDSRAATVNEAISLLKGGPGAGLKPTQAHVDALRKNPDQAAEFDKKFGAGSSKLYLPVQSKK